MKSLICTTPGQFEYKDMEQPAAQPGQSVIKIKRIGICGTDLHAFEGTQPFFNYPRILGHELAAEYITGDAEGFEQEEKVTIIPYFHCGQCIACRSGKPNCCVQIQVCGVHTDGGMVEYLTVPSDALLHGERLSFDELALVEPLAIGAHAIRRAAIQPDEYVLVIGAGPIGLGVMAFAHMIGAKVIALDINQQRLAFCSEKLHIPFTINAANEDTLQRLKEITNGDMPTAVIDATGSLKAIENSFNYIAHGGRYVLVGLQKGNICFNHPEFHKREATLMSSRNATKSDFEQVINSIKKGAVQPLSFITHRVLFSEVKDEFAQWLNPENNVIKAMVAID